MSSGNDLQEMEVGTTQSKTAVNAGAGTAEPNGKTIWCCCRRPRVLLQKMPSSDDDSNKVKEPGATLNKLRTL